ncbi:hypothetical protein ABZ957_15475 [Streptomyces sp. NPDC046316]|uniref:hypothetical protein n=1 Tax=Streptomyces sp. NPDC046316 TaxID=3154494 RepID=UPI0033F631C5
MSALLNTPKRVARQFREDHGPMDDWTAEEFDLFQELLAVAWRGPLPRLRLRLKLLTWTTVALPVYFVGSLLWTLFHQVSPWLEDITDRADDRCTAVETACSRAGDQAFVDYVGEFCHRLVDLLDRVNDRLARG